MTFCDDLLFLIIPLCYLLPQLAAKRFVNYWRCRKQLFGPEKYLMRMTLGEALKDDLEAIEDGVFCLLPFKDSSGRQLLHLEPGRKSDGQYSSGSLVSLAKLSLY